jgi:hypothetical protein
MNTTEASCGVIHVSEINKVISEADAEGLNSFFLEGLSKPGVRAKKHDKGSFLLFLALGYFCIINADVPYFFNLESFLPFFLPQVF